MSSYTIVSPDIDIEGGTLEKVEKMLIKSHKDVSAVANESQSKDLAWTKMIYRVGTKVILNNCWGKVSANTICAILGPSGAGKTSLLNVLAGRTATSGKYVVNGLITVGGEEINPIVYRNNIAYVMQDDSLMPTATPREVLTFSAILRLQNHSISIDEINILVEKLLEDLELLSCADMLIGGGLVMGISGGEKKRVSVGVELITKPTLLFLDEPTSGLDSYSSFQLIKLLKQIAHSNCTILFTIHQPSSETFYLFDSVIYMKSGFIFYHGTAEQVIPYCATFGMVCPPDYNPSDFIMDIIQSEKLEFLQEKHMFMKQSIEFQITDITSNKKHQHDILLHKHSSFLKQLTELTKREFRNVYRDKTAFFARFAITIMLNLLIGLIFLHVCEGTNGNMDEFNAHVGGVSLVMLFGLVGPAQQIMVSFPIERPMFLREYTTGTYQAPAYFLSKLLSEAPLTFAQIIVQYVLVHNMMGMRGNFILMVLVSFSLSMVSGSVAMMLGCAVTGTKSVAELAPLLFIPQILFAGFFIRTSQIPIFLRWAQYLCGMKYAMNLILLLEFRPTLPSCTISTTAKHNCQSVLNSNYINESEYWVYIVLLIALFVSFRLLAGFVLVHKARKFY